MRSKDSRAIVERFLLAARERDAATMRELAAEDIRVVEAASLPFGGVHVGLDGFLSLVRKVFTQLGVTKLDVERIIAEDDVVVVLAILRGRSVASGEAFEMPITEVWYLAEGRIREVRPFYLDTHLVLALVQPSREG